MCDKWDNEMCDKWENEMCDKWENDLNVTYQLSFYNLLTFAIIFLLFFTFKRSLLIFSSAKRIIRISCQIKFVYTFFAPSEGGRWIRVFNPLFFYSFFINFKTKPQKKKKK
jgi:hypothetical protein